MCDNTWLIFCQNFPPLRNACISQNGYRFLLLSYLHWKPVTTSGQQVSIVLPLKVKTKATKSHTLPQTSLQSSQRTETSKMERGYQRIVFTFNMTERMNRLARRWLSVFVMGRCLVRNQAYTDNPECGSSCVVSLALQFIVQHSLPLGTM